MSAKQVTGMIQKGTPCYWEPNVANVFGHYTNISIYIENNYFRHWRHCVSPNSGVHYVARFNIVDEGYGFGEFDGHGSYATESAPEYAGTRAMENLQQYLRKS